MNLFWLFSALTKAKRIGRRFSDSQSFTNKKGINNGILRVVEVGGLLAGGVIGLWQIEGTPEGFGGDNSLVERGGGVNSLVFEVANAVLASC